MPESADASVSRARYASTHGVQRLEPLLGRIDESRGSTTRRRSFWKTLLIAEITEQDGRFSLGPLAPGLRDLGTARLGLESYHARGELAHTLRTGTPAFDRVYDKRFY